MIVFLFLCTSIDVSYLSVGKVWYFLGKRRKEFVLSSDKFVVRFNSFMTEVLIIQKPLNITHIYTGEQINGLVSI